MMHIYLHNLRFHSFHGLYPEEQNVGNDYEVNVSVGYEPAKLPVEKLEETLDYTQLYQLVKNHMNEPTPLLETIATKMAEEIRLKYGQVTRISVSIRKLYPPVNSFEGAVGVSFEWHK